MAKPLPQVAFRKFGEDNWKWFLEKELDLSKEWERYRTEADTKIVGDDASVQRLAQRLISLGVVFKKSILTRRGELVQVFAESILDDVIFRCVAKIAFNFLAYVKGSEFVRRPDFDSIRQFIRSGVKLSEPPVIVTTIPILFGDDTFYRQTNGHIVALDWSHLGTAIVCQVSLFNHLTYNVLLCMAYSGIWHPLRAGRHFDVKTKTISNLVPT